MKQTSSQAQQQTDEPLSQVSNQSINHLLFCAGGLNLAADASSVHCIHESLTTQPETGTQEWFLGLAVADERLLPVTDLGAYLHKDQSVGRVIEVARALGIAGLRIDDVHGVSHQAPQAADEQALESIKTVIDQLQRDVASPLAQQVIHDKGNHYHVIDVAMLVQSKRFLNVAAIPV